MSRLPDDELFKELNRTERSVQAREETLKKLQKRIGQNRRPFFPVFLSGVFTAAAIILLTIVLFDSNLRNIMKQGMANEDIEYQIIEGQEVYSFNSMINLEGTDQLPEDVAANLEPKSRITNEQLAQTNLIMQLQVRSSEGLNDHQANVSGSIQFAEDRLHQYKAEGPLTKVTNPETNQIYYSGTIQASINDMTNTQNGKEEGEASHYNGGFVIVFDAANPDEHYIAFTVGLADIEGTILFGDKDVYADWQLAVEASGSKMNWD